MTATHGSSAGEDLGERKQGKRMSCNGCRVLRKGCSDTCILRPCLQWIESPEAQGHATVFVAKFFGRAGLMSFITAVPDNQRPALFQSLLYEACGRTVNPVHGAVGLLWTGNWQICQAAVESVLKGGSLRPPSSTMPTRPSLMNNHLCLRNNMEISRMRADDFSWMTAFKVKAEPLESQDPRFHLPPFDMADRRVRQRIGGNYSNQVKLLPDVKANLDLTLNCEHSLSPHLSRRVSSPSMVSVNSEGSVTSLESGSLTLTDQRASAAKDQKVLDLFP